VEKITSRGNPLCVHVKKLGKSKNYRDECKEFICDGIKLLKDAINSGAEIICIITSKIIPFDLPENTRVFQMEYSLLKSISPLSNPQDIIFTCKYLEQNNLAIESGTHFLLDDVQDPGNVGTILRTANAFNIDSIILTAGCADVYNPKTVRASMGSVFKQAFRLINENNITDLSKMKIICTLNDVNAKNITDVDFNNIIIVLGNEGNGISEKYLKICDDMIKIPISDNCESLNVASAASIMMWEKSKHNGGVEYDR